MSVDVQSPVAGLWDDPAERRFVRGDPAWMHSYVRRVFVVDLVATALAALIAKYLRFGLDEANLRLSGGDLPYALVAAVMVPLWVLLVGVAGGYDRRHLGAGSEEFRRILRAGVFVFVAVSIVVFATRLPIARGFVGGLIPSVIVLTFAGRWLCRQWLRRMRRQGRAMHRVIAVGDRSSVLELTIHLHSSRWAGYSVIGACTPNPHEPFQRAAGAGVPILGGPDDILRVLETTHADVVAITNTESFADGRLRRLAWELEGSGVDLIVAPAVTDLAGPRISIRPVSGLPLLHVEEPRLSGPARVFKECFDRILALVTIVVLAPFALIVAGAVLLTSGRPILFGQERIGRRGIPFRIYKFRTMVRDAEGALESLIERNEHDGLLFKIRDDPRITPVGRWLRRFSLDELPQLLNVVAGQMSLVGPRPPLRREVEKYGDDVKRRLLVKPGVTGLWQVSGRADIPWEEAVRLDLYYVDNWSPAMDLVILWKTARAVLTGQGAY